MIKAVRKRIDRVLDTTPREQMKNTNAATRKAAFVATHTSLADVGVGVKNKALGLLPGKRKKKNTGVLQIYDEREHQD